MMMIMIKSREILSYKSYHKKRSTKPVEALLPIEAQQQHVHKQVSSSMRRMMIKLRKILPHHQKRSKKPVKEQQQQPQPVEAQQQHVHTQEEASSIFLAGTYHPANPKFVAVVKYDLNKLTKEELPEFECVAQFTPGDEHNHNVKLNKLYNRIVWKACVHNSISNSTSTTLCLLPVYLYKTKNASDASGIEEDAPLTAYIYDIKTAEILKKFKAPEASKFSGLVFCLEYMIYCMAYPPWTNIKQRLSFQRYDLKNEETKNLKSFPWDDDSNEKILGYAVFQDFVLFSVYPTGLWAYFVRGDKWYEVSFDNQPPSFQGVGVVVDKNTIYALKECKGDSILLKLLVNMKKGNDDAVEFTASQEQELILQDRYYSRYKTRDWDKDVLVHLGEHKFCLVRNGLLGKGYNLQLLQLVMFTVEKEEVIVSDILEHQVEICEYSPFKPILGFSLPAFHSKQFKDKQKNGLGSNITLDPFFSSEEIQEAVQ
jgi:hypothetical protein